MNTRTIPVAPSSASRIDPVPRARKWLRGLYAINPWLGYNALLVYNSILRALRPAWLARTCSGARLLCRLDDVVQKSIFHFGVWEPEITALVSTRLRPGDTFIDIGANVGYFTLIGAGLVGSDGHVVGIEPSPSLCRLLRANVARNGVNNVRVVEKAVAAEAGVVALFRGIKGNVGMTTTRPSDALELEARVAAGTLMEILGPRELRRARLAKIDVEGAEIPILRDILSNLDAFSSEFEIIVEIDPSNLAEASAIFGQFVQRGFTVLRISNVFDTREFLAGHALEALRAVDLPLAHGGDFLLGRLPR